MARGRPGVLPLQGLRLRHPHRGGHGDPPFIFAVNARMMAGLDPANVRIRRKNNSHSGFFWTRPDAPIEESRHPPMPPPTFEDWR